MFCNCDVETLDSGYESIVDDNQCLFDEVAVTNGQQCYDDHCVKEVLKLDNVFVADVLADDLYTVRVFDDDETGLIFSCNCGCDGNCAHEYAVLLAIQNGRYVDEQLRPYVDKITVSLHELIGKIPADQLKKYLQSVDCDDCLCIDKEQLENAFIQYVPKQSYDYYYNNFYNHYLLKEDICTIYNDYFSEIKKYVDCKDYEQAFYIIKSIVEVTHDLNIDITNDYPELGMYLRISYRKADIEVKKIIEKYVMKLVFNQYYDNCYLEDMISNMN